MSVYIEYVIIDNLVINSLILLCVKSTLKLNSKWWRVLISACLGTLVAVLLPLFDLSSMVQVPIKLGLGVAMVLILSSFLRFREFVFAFLLFVLYTVLLMGACMVTLFAFGTSLEALSAGGYDIALPLGIIFAIVALYVCIIIYLVKFLNRRRDLMPFIRKVQLTIRDKELTFNAFIDTGNKLVDAKTGLPVVIMSIEALGKHFSINDLEELMLMTNKAGEVFKNAHTCAYNTISGDAKKMVVFEADKLVISGGQNEYITNRFVVGVTYKKFKDAINYDCLLSPMVL